MHPGFGRVRDGAWPKEGFRGFESDLRAPHACSGARRSLFVLSLPRLELTNSVDPKRKTKKRSWEDRNRVLVEKPLSRPPTKRPAESVDGLTSPSLVL